MSMNLPSGSDVRRIAFAYPIEADTHLFRDRPAWVDTGEAELDDLYDVVSWKAPRVKTRFRSSDYNQRVNVRALTRRALGSMADWSSLQDEAPVVNALQVLRELDFINTRVATAVLAVFRPRLFTVLDWRAWSVMVAYGIDGINPNANLDRYDSYLTYLHACHRLSRTLDVNLRTLDRCLWVLGGTTSKSHRDFLSLRSAALDDNRW